MQTVKIAEAGVLVAPAELVNPLPASMRAPLAYSSRNRFRQTPPARRATCSSPHAADGPESLKLAR